MKYDVKDIYGNTKFTAEIDCAEDAPKSKKLRLAAFWAIDSGKDLSHADLRGADFSDADFRCANLSHADLRGADFRGAILRYADLRGADFRGADFRGADFSYADFRYADLRGADFRGADFKEAIGAELAIAKTRILPEGQIIGWKRCRKGVLVELSIPADAPRSHAFGRKCRAAFADCLEVIGADEGVSIHDPRVVYRAGERVTADKWDEDWQQECAGGIHFFITREEAEAH